VFHGRGGLVVRLRPCSVAAGGVLLRRGVAAWGGRGAAARRTGCCFSPRGRGSSIVLFDLEGTRLLRGVVWSPVRKLERLALRAVSGVRERARGTWLVWRV
jgi:hypothetical protein